MVIRLGSLSEDSLLSRRWIYCNSPLCALLKLERQGQKRQVPQTAQTNTKGGIQDSCK